MPDEPAAASSAPEPPAKDSQIEEPRTSRVPSASPSAAAGLVTLGLALVWMLELGVSLWREVSLMYFAGWLAVMLASIGVAWLIGLRGWKRWAWVAAGAVLGGILLWRLGPGDYGEAIRYPVFIAWLMLLILSDSRPRF